MLDSYHRLCAYLSLYIEHATGSPSVDHVIPKSKAWDKVYEWSNYRLAAALVNSKKNHLEVVLDPFEIDDGIFALEFVCFQVTRGTFAIGGIETRLTRRSRQLGLNRRACCEVRREYVQNYEGNKIKLEYLERCAPFIARELRRQGRLNKGDL